MHPIGLRLARRIFCTRPNRSFRKTGSPLDPICAAEPNAADVFLLRGAHLFDLVSKSRGTKTADRTSEEQIAQACEFINAAISSRRAIQLAPGDPTPHVFALRRIQVFSDLHKNLHQAYQAAIQNAPDFVPADCDAVIFDECIFMQV